MAKNKIYIPTFISSVNYAPARVLPHIYFYNGLKACETYYIQGYSNGNTGSVVSTEVTSFPYFDNYEGQDPTSGSRSLLFFNEPAVYGTTPTGSLYTNYWETYVSLLYNPKTRLINCEGIIPLADYFKMELNDIVEWRGNYYHLRAINDYNLSNGECKIQLLGPILEDVIASANKTITCLFDFDSQTVTTTTTTAGPTTTTTAGPTTTTTLAPTTTTTSTTSTTSTTTTTAAPTTTTTSTTSTTTTSTTSTTTTAAPTTTTTTAGTTTTTTAGTTTTTTAGLIEWEGFNTGSGGWPFTSSIDACNNAAAQKAYKTTNSSTYLIANTDYVYDFVTLNPLYTSGSWLPIRNSSGPGPWQSIKTNNTGLVTDVIACNTSPNVFTINYRTSGTPYIETAFQTGSNAVSMSVQNSADGTTNWIDTQFSKSIADCSLITLNDGQKVFVGNTSGVTIPTGSYWRLKQTNSDSSLLYSDVQNLTTPYNMEVYTCDGNIYGYTSTGTLRQNAGAIWSSGTTGFPNTCFQIIKYLGAATTGSFYSLGTVPTGCNDTSKCII